MWAVVEIDAGVLQSVNVFLTEERAEKHAKEVMEEWSGKAFEKGQDGWSSKDGDVDVYLWEITDPS